MTQAQAACTIIAQNYLAQARVLARSFTEHHDGARLQVLVLDDREETIGLDEPFDVVRPYDIMAAGEFGRMATMYSVVELATAVKPFLLRWILGNGARSAAYFDPDIRIFTPLGDVFEAAETRGVALTPHALAPLPRGDALTEPEDVILDVGIFNLGFIAVGTDTPALEWWAERLARECIIDPTNGRFVDQRWVDLFVGYFDPAILRDPGMNVAWWNLATRRLTEVGAGYSVDGQHPLRFFHFSGYDPRMPWLVSRHQGPLPRVTMANDPALQRITGEYAAALAADGFDEWTTVPYGLDMTSSGVPLETPTRRLYRNALVEAEEHDSPPPPHAFDNDDSAFIQWLAQPDPNGSGPSPASRYLHAAWLASPELRATYPDPHGADAAGIVEWARSGGAPTAIAGALGAPAEPAPRQQTSQGLHVVGMLHSDRTDAEVGRRLITTALEAGLAVEATAVTHLAGPGDVPLPAGTQRGNMALNVIVMPVDRIAEAYHLIGEAKRHGRRTAALITGACGPEVAVPQDVAGILDEAWFMSRAAESSVQGLNPHTLTRTLPLALDAPSARTQDPDPDLVVTVIDAAEGSQPDIGLTVTAFEAIQAARRRARQIVGVVHADHDGQLMEHLAYVASRVTGLEVKSISPRSARALIASAGMVTWLPRTADAALTVVDSLTMGIPVFATASGQVLDLSACRSLIPIDVTADVAIQVGTALAGVTPTRDPLGPSALGGFLRDRAREAVERDRGISRRLLRRARPSAWSR